MEDNKRMMRRRGRPRKASEADGAVRKSRTLRLSDEEYCLVADKARKCRRNFSDYCRKVLLGYQPSVPDAEFRDGLLAARKDMVNFINFIKGMKMGPEERKQFLAQMPTIQTWWKCLFAEIEFIDRQMKRM